MLGSARLGHVGSARLGSAITQATAKHKNSTAQHSKAKHSTTAKHITAQQSKAEHRAPQEGPHRGAQVKAKHANNTAQQTRAQQQSTTQHSTAEHRAAWEYPQGDHFEKAIVSPFKGNEHNNTSNSEAQKQYSTTQ